MIPKKDRAQYVAVIKMTGCKESEVVAVYYRLRQLERTAHSLAEKYAMGSISDEWFGGE